MYGTFIRVVALATILFGYGIGQTPDLTVLKLGPHNDYLRMLVEYGPFNLVIFVCFLLHVLFNLKAGLTKVLFMVLMIYFFSENLIDHFASMTLYFTYAGRFSARSEKDESSIQYRAWGLGCSRAELRLARSLGWP